MAVYQDNSAITGPWTEATPSSGADRGFYVTGGTLPTSAECYVARRADLQILEALTRGDFCHILTSRQMGKSSLVVRTAAALRRSGGDVAVIDLTAIGQNVTVEQWYDGLLGLLGQQLDLEDELEAFWKSHLDLGPLRRWALALQNVALAGRTVPLTIFIDEIDAVRSLPFPADEFFAAIRECFNRRPHDPVYRLLTFCLVGVSTPADLIRDTRTTPFNIGCGVELTDFSLEEALSLTRGLPGPERQRRKMLERVLYWTGGHPYLTQRLCQAAASGEPSDPKRTVDRACRALFFERVVREQEHNLIFVRERLLRSGEDLVETLQLYRRVLGRGRVPDLALSPTAGALRLAGVVRSSGGALRHRNRVYRRVFNRGWIRDHLPDAEIRRQKTAFWQGVLRTSLVSGAITLVMAALAAIAIQKSLEARDREAVARSYLYVANINLAQQAIDQGNPERAEELLGVLTPRPGQDDLRTFAWYYLWRLSHWPELRTLYVRTGRLSGAQQLTCAAFSPDGKVLAAGSDDGTLNLWDTRTWRLRGAPLRQADSIRCMAFAPDGSMLAAGGPAGIDVWRTDSPSKVVVLHDSAGPVRSLVFSPDSKTLASTGPGGAVLIWDTGSWKKIHTLAAAPASFCSLAFSPDGSLLAGGGADGSLKLWNAHTLHSTALNRGHSQAVRSIAFSPDAQLIATGADDCTVRLWNVRRPGLAAVLRSGSARAMAVAFSPDGRYLAEGSDDQTSWIWDVRRQREMARLTGHGGRVSAVAFQPGTGLLATAGEDGSVTCWGPSPSARMLFAALHHGPTLALGHISLTGDLVAGFADGAVLTAPPGSGTGVTEAKRVQTPALFARLPAVGTSNVAGRTWTLRSLAFSPDGQTAAVGRSDARTALWDLKPRRRTRLLFGHWGAVSAAAFLPHSDAIVTGGWDRLPMILEMTTRRRQRSFSGGYQQIRALAISPDGSILASGGDAGEIDLWSLSDGKKTGRLKVGAEAVSALAISPDSRTLAAGQVDGSVTVWYLPTSQQLLAIPGQGAVRSLVFSPDGRTLYSGNQDGQVFAW